MANSGPNTNLSQFFFTFEACPWLDKKNTIFAKVTGPTIYNMNRLGQGEIGENDTPLHPQKIERVSVVNNPFPDIVVREREGEKDKEKEKEEKKKKKKKKKK